MKQGKRWIALMLALAMCLSVLPANVLATELGGEAEAAEAAAPEDTSETVEAEEPQVTETGEPDEEPVEDVSPSTMAATSGKCGKNVTWKLDRKGTLTISGKGAMKNGLSHESAAWYSARRSIKKIIIKNGVTSIGNFSFQDCVKLEKVNVANSVTKIGDFAFDGCSNIKSIKIPSKITDIGTYAFCGCEKLEHIDIPDGVKGIGMAAFSNCSRLKDIKLPKNAKYIGRGAFTECTSLKEIVIPSKVEEIVLDAFWGCSNLTKIYFTGKAPVFDEWYDDGGSIFGNVTATAYYPKGDKSWTSDKLQNYGGNITWKTWTPYEKPDFFVLGKDSNSYKHSSVAFGLSSDKKSCTKYTEDSIGKTYPTALKLYSKLLTGINGIKEEAKLQEAMNEEWGGSCLGLTLSMIMSKNGRLDVSKFRTDKTKGNAKYYYALWPPAQNLELRNLISYYYLLQKVNQFPITQATYNSIGDKLDGLVSGKTNTKWAEFWKNFYKEVKKASDKKKSILFGYKAGDAMHVILTCGYDDSNPDYMIIKLFDCNTVGAEFSPGNNSHQNVLEKGCYSYIYISKTSKKFKNDEDFYMVYATPWGNSSYGIEHNNWHFFFYTSLIDLNKIDAADEYYRSPYATKLLSVKSRPSKTIKVTWLKRENVLGYEVQCDTSTKFKNRRSVIIQKENANSTTISNLKKGKKYYVRIRTYKTVSGKTYYSSWSKLKSTIVKK